MKLIFGLVVALVLAFFLPARAAVLWYGGEDTSFVQSGTVSSSTAAGLFTAAYSRAAIGSQNGTSTSDPPTNRMTPTAWTAACSGTPCWVHAVFYSNSNAMTNNEQVLWLGNTSDNVGRLYVRQTATAGTFKISTAKAARSFTDVLTF